MTDDRPIMPLFGGQQAHDDGPKQRLRDEHVVRTFVGRFMTDPAIQALMIAPLARTLNDDSNPPSDAARAEAAALIEKLMDTLVGTTAEGRYLSIDLDRLRNNLPSLELLVTVARLVSTNTALSERIPDEACMAREREAFLAKDSLG